MAVVMRRQNWRYISAVNSDSNYEKAAMAAFFSASHSQDKNENICIGKRYSLGQDATIEDAKKILTELKRQNGMIYNVCSVVKPLLFMYKFLHADTSFMDRPDVCFIPFMTSLTN